MICRTLSTGTGRRWEGTDTAGARIIGAECKAGKCYHHGATSCEERIDILAKMPEDSAITLVQNPGKLRERNDPL